MARCLLNSCWQIAESVPFRESTTAAEFTTCHQDQPLSRDRKSFVGRAPLLIALLCVLRLPIPVNAEAGDPAGNNVSQQVDSSLKKRIEAADGFVEDRVAMVLSLPEAIWSDFNEAMLKFGFRPTSIRPYENSSGIVIGAGWVRDGKSSFAQLGLSFAEAEKIAHKAARVGLLLTDFTAYGPQHDRYALLCVEDRDLTRVRTLALPRPEETLLTNEEPNMYLLDRSRRGRPASRRRSW